MNEELTERIIGQIKGNLITLSRVTINKMFKKMSENPTRGYFLYDVGIPIAGCEVKVTMEVRRLNEGILPEPVKRASPNKFSNKPFDQLSDMVSGVFKK